MRQDNQALPNEDILQALSTQQARLQEAKLRFFFQEIWFGPLLNQIDYKVTTSPLVKTACTDGKVAYFSLQFMQTLTLDELVFVLAHELLHCLLDHLARKGVSRRKSVWNYACDYAINAMLIKYKIGTPIKGILHNPDYAGLTADEIYEFLGEINRNKSANTAFEQEQKATSIDEHMEPDEFAVIEETSIKDSTFSESKEETQQTGDIDWRQVIQEALDKKDTSDPSLLDECANLYRDYYKSSTDWRGELREFLRTKLEYDMSYNRPHRKTQGSGMILPTQRREDTLHLAIALDTSGSMQDRWISQFLAEVVNILDSYINVKIDLWSFNEQVKNAISIDASELESIVNYKARCTGGTSYGANWQFLEEQDLDPDVFIILTDGEPNDEDWGEPSTHCECLFAIIGSTDIVAPYGRTLYIR
jgi:predicted metal-dependent peptidase